MKAIIENPWIFTIVTGLIVTIVGGFILNKILKNQRSKKQSFKLENDGVLEVNKDLVVGTIEKKESSQPREHEVKLGEESKTIVKENFIIGSKKST